ncbi:MAG: cell division ATP-binding protein FtsE [Coriobacteriales bacterium]|nr:cell division ATP-binding protein FtsE [Coriobacteriales bacterium]
MSNLPLGISRGAHNAKNSSRLRKDAVDSSFSPEKQNSNMQDSQQRSSRSSRRNINRNVDSVVPTLSSKGQADSASFDPVINQNESPFASSDSIHQSRLQRRQNMRATRDAASDMSDLADDTKIKSYADLQDANYSNRKLGPVVIALRNVTKVYPAQSNKPAIKGLSLDIHSGEFVFLVGHSCSGKSTFIRMLIREVVPTSGEIVVAGENLKTIKNWRIPYLRRNVGCVFQDFKLLPNKTTFENVAFALEVIGKSKHVIKTQVPEVLRLVGLEEKMHKFPDQLSGGEQQRVSIARSIVNRPPLLICDEPTGNLDPQTSLGIMRLLERINKTGTTVLVATHDREMVDQMRRRVLALENGVLVRDQKKGVYGDDV